MRLRYGENFAGAVQPIQYGEALRLDGVTVSFHPAGHVLGSAQILVEADGLRIVASGGYEVSRSDVPVVEPVFRNVFITEATFGLPVFRRAGDPDAEIEKLMRSVTLFPERAHLVGAYSLGTAQRVMALLRGRGYDRPIYLHGAVEAITRYYASRIDLGEFDWPVTPPRPILPAQLRSARHRS